MIANQLDELTIDYQHVVLSPHLDDAALSCGGMLAALRAHRQTALVVVVCTAAPDPHSTFNALAQEFHAQWNLQPGEAVSARLTEERAAYAVLGVDALWLGELDAIYRAPDVYVSRESLFAPPPAADPLHAALRAAFTQLRARLPQATFYAPLCIGEHADHQITHTAALAVCGPLRFYEDMPYVIWPGRRGSRLAQLGPEYRPAASVPFDEATLERKLAAIRCYASQIPELWRGANPVTRMEHSIREHAAASAPAGAMYGERMWEAESKVQ